MKSMQKGFTLIELMIVVAIIAILAAIAIPQYQTYIVKSQVTRAIGEAGDLKTMVEDCLNNGQVTIGPSAAGANTTCDPNATGSDILTGATQGSIVLAANTGVPQISTPLSGTAANTITATFGNNASATINGMTVTWTRNAAGTWTCATSVPNKYAPQSCPGT